MAPEVTSSLVGGIFFFMGGLQLLITMNKDNYAIRQYFPTAEEQFLSIVTALVVIVFGLYLTSTDHLLPFFIGMTISFGCLVLIASLRKSNSLINTIAGGVLMIGPFIVLIVTS